MNTVGRTLKTALALFSVGTSLFLAVPGRADTLTFSSSPASNAVAEMSRRYGVSIVFRSAVNSSQLLTFSVDNADTPDGRVQAMNALGNALGLDFQKVFVVSKIDAGTSVPEVKIDNDAPVAFPAGKVSAREAIQTIAGVDGALTQVSSAISGTVVFPSRRMTAAAAAASVARQTRTVWRAYYGFFKRGQEPARLQGEVVDRDINGQPIRALPLVTFRTHISTPAPITGLDGDPGNLSATSGPSVTSVPNIGTGLVPGFGFSPYGSDPYGYGSPFGLDDFGYGGFGYPAPNGGVAYPGLNYTPGAGIEPVVPGANAPGLFPPGSTVTSAPTGSTTILPDFPFSGSSGSTFGGY